jgi:hypothetical protein
MAFDVSALTDYVDQTSKDLLTKAHFANETSSYATKQPGIKSAEALQILTTGPIPQNGAACGYTSSGSTTFTQRTLTVKPVKWQEDLCPRTLEAKWTQLLLSAGSKYSEKDIPSMVMQDIVRVINEQLETCDWQGDTNAGSAYLNKYDGLVKVITGASGILVPTASTFNSTNCRTIMKNIINKIPAALKGKSTVKVVLGYDALEVYRQKLMDDNLYHVPAGNGVGTMYAEGSVYELVPVHGLDGLYSISGQACVFAFEWSNIFMGCDMLNEEEKAAMWYSQDFDVVKYFFSMKRGWQVAFPQQIVAYSNS